MARRLHLSGVAFRPAWYHVAYVAHQGGFAFVDPARQGRFLALLRDLEPAGSLLEITTAIAAGRVSLDGQPYAWEADDMVLRIDGVRPNESDVSHARDAAHFTHSLR
jgi:hypothetical protein